MTSIVKLVGISSCCIALGTAAANADPVPLADAELDRVTAGACRAGLGAQFCNDMPGGIPVLPTRPTLDFLPGEPIAFDPPPVEVPRGDPLGGSGGLGSWTFQLRLPGYCGGPASSCPRYIY